MIIHCPLYLVTIFLPICAFTDEWGKNDRIALMMDMSSTCVEDVQVDIFLPYGMGVVDALVIVVSDNDLYPNCAIRYFCVGSKENVYIILVIEFPDNTVGPHNACQDSNSGIYIIDPSTQVKIDICGNVNKKEKGLYEIATYSTVVDASNVTVIISSKSLFETVKITATAARKVGPNDICQEPYEIQCNVYDNTLCVSSELLCDENINCGRAYIDDEDVRVCDVLRYQRLWLVVVCGLAMLLIIVFFMIHLLHSCVPPVSDSFFIFNEDEDNKLIVTPQKCPVPAYKLEEIKTPEKRNSSYKFNTTSIISDGHQNDNTSVTSSEIELKNNIYQKFSPTNPHSFPIKKTPETKENILKTIGKKESPPTMVGKKESIPKTVGKKESKLETKDKKLKKKLEGKQSEKKRLKGQKKSESLSTDDINRLVNFSPSKEDEKPEITEKNSKKRSEHSMSIDDSVQKSLGSRSSMQKKIITKKFD